jgi:hypothetical protein
MLLFLCHQIIKNISLLTFFPFSHTSLLTSYGYQKGLDIVLSSVYLMAATMFNVIM